MDHRWDDWVERERITRREQDRYRQVEPKRDDEVTRRDRLREREEREPRRRPSSPWEIGRAHWDQTDLYTKGSSTDEEGYGVGPDVHPEIGSYAYPRSGEPEPEPNLPPHELYEREAWPWRNYDVEEARRIPHEGFWDRLAERMMIALLGEPPETRFLRSGPKGWCRPDASIHDDVCRALTRHGELDASDIEVEVKSSEVTLTGTVPDRRSKHLAEDVTESCMGVTDVHNRLKIRPDDGSLFGPERAFAG